MVRAVGGRAVSWMAAAPPLTRAPPPAPPLASHPCATLWRVPRFYDKAHKLDVLDFFKGVAVHPDALPPLVFGAVGRCVWRDVGTTALGFRLMMKVIDYSFMAALTALAAPLLPDFKRAVAAGAAAGKGKKAA